MAAPEGALTGFKLLDLTTARSGPTCVRFLADMGADVIQIVRPSSSLNETRLTIFDSENLHRNKRSMVLDLQKPEGKDVFMRLVKDADIVVENYRPDVKHRLGIDYEAVSAVNPRIVYGSISGFGEDGPYKRRPAVDQIIQAMGGMMSITGFPGDPPLRVGIAISDLSAGITLAGGILAALVERSRSGKGQWVHTSLIEAMISMLDFQATRWLIDHEVPGPAGNDHPTVFPSGVFDTAEGQISIAATSNRMWNDFVRVLELPELLEDERFQDRAGRARNREALRVICQERLLTKTALQWTDELNAVGVPAGPIYTVDQTFADPQVQHLHMAAPVESPLYGHLDLLRLAVTLDRTPPSVRTPAPVPGADTEAILRENGFSDAEIAALTEGGVVSASA